MEPPSYRDSYEPAKIGRVVHVSHANEIARAFEALGNEPVGVLAEIEVRSPDEAIGQPQEGEGEREDRNDGKRKQKCLSHLSSGWVDEPCDSCEQTNRYSHPPRCQKADFGSADPLRDVRVQQLELREFESGEVLVRDGVADLIVEDAEGARGEHSDDHKCNESDESLHGLKKRPEKAFSQKKGSSRKMKLTPLSPQVNPVPDGRPG